MNIENCIKLHGRIPVILQILIMKKITLGGTRPWLVFPVIQWSKPYINIYYNTAALLRNEATSCLPGW